MDSLGQRHDGFVTGPSRDSLGFVGLGHMGTPMARNLLEHGYELTVYDRDPHRAARLAEGGARIAHGLRDIAAARLVLLSLPGSREVEEVVLAPDGLLVDMAAGSCLVSLCTVSPSLVRQIAEAAKGRGVSLVDAPVTGAADGAAAGTLTIMVGADPADLARCRSVLEPLSCRIAHVGPVGAGSAVKLVTNMLWFTHIVALSDALALGVASGIAVEALAEVIPDSAGGSWVARHDLPNILRSEDDLTFTLALCVKDLGLIDELLQETGVHAPLAATAAERFAQAHERYGGAAGELAVTRLAEEAAGVSIRSDFRMRDQRSLNG